jgi:hypothetical protein
LSLLPRYELGAARLLRLFVRRVLAAGVAELGELKTASGGLLVLGGGVVPVLAIGTLQGDNFAHWLVLLVANVASHLGWQAAWQIWKGIKSPST